MSNFLVGRAVNDKLQNLLLTPGQQLHYISWHAIVTNGFAEIGGQRQCICVTLYNRKVGGKTITYDPRGNQTSETTSGVTTGSYTWDAHYRMTQAVVGGVTVGYTYNLDGLRTRQNLAGTVTNYMWDERSAYGDVVAEFNASNVVTASYVLGGNGIISQTRSGTTNYYLAGEQRLLVDLGIRGDGRELALEGVDLANGDTFGHGSSPSTKSGETPAGALPAVVPPRGFHYTLNDKSILDAA